jgi:hypothetical protein
LKQIKTVFSFIFIVFGLGIIAVSKIAEQVVPKNGMYHVDVTLNYWLGGLSIVGGMVYLITHSKAFENNVKVMKERNIEFEENNKQ